MLIDNIDFAALYQRQLTLAGRHKTAEHWDQRAQKMASRCANPQDSYLRQLLSAIDLTAAHSLLDVGCGPGSVCLNLAGQLDQVYGIDYSAGMLAVAKARAQQLRLSNVTLHQCAWEDDWSQLPRCDIAVASRSTLVADLRQALEKLNAQARLRVYTTHPVNSTFVDRQIQQAIGREVVELPNYIYAVNILYQMGIHACVSFIHAPRCQPADDISFDSLADSVAWSLGALNEDEQQRLFDFYQQRQRQGKPVQSHGRDWALVYWQHQPQESE